MRHTNEQSAVSGFEFLVEAAQRHGAPAAFERFLRFRLSKVGEGAVTVRAEPAENFTNPMGTLHGGYLATLLDAAMGAAVHSLLMPEQNFTTVELKVNFMKAARLPFTQIHATGKVRKAGRRIAFAEGAVYSASHDLIASGSATCLLWHADSGKSGQLHLDEESHGDKAA